MWPNNTWLDIWPNIWPAYSFEQERLISIFQELFRKTEYYSIDNVILQTRVLSDIINIMEDIVDILFEDTSIATNVKNLINTTFISGSEVDNNITTIQTFATNLNTLLNG
jgi:hypothetical protein